MTTLVTKYAGVDLASLGVECEVLEGIESAPPVRGSINNMNLVIPYQHGQRWVPKYYDERPIVLKGLMIPTGAGNFMYSTDALRQLFPIGAGEQKLEVSRPDGSNRYIMAEVRNTLALARDASQSPAASKFSIELAASDPFWYGSALAGGGSSGAWTLNSGVLLDDGVHFLDNIGSLFAQNLTTQQTIVACRNIGTTYNRKVVFSLAQTPDAAVTDKPSMNNPRITNLRNGYFVQVNVSNPFGGVLTIDCGAQSSTPVAGGALGTGQVDWMRLEAGDNNLLVDLGVTPGAPVAFQASFNPSYL